MASSFYWGGSRSTRRKPRPAVEYTMPAVRNEPAISVLTDHVINSRRRRTTLTTRNRNANGDEARQDFEIITVSDFEQYIADIHEKSKQEYNETKDLKSYANRFSSELKKFVRTKSLGKYDVNQRQETIHEDESDRRCKTNGPNYNMSTEEFVDVNFRRRPLENQPIENLRYMSQHYGSGHCIANLYANAPHVNKGGSLGRLRSNTTASVSHRRERSPYRRTLKQARNYPKMSSFKQSVIKQSLKNAGKHKYDDDDMGRAGKEEDMYRAKTGFRRRNTKPNVTIKY